MLRAIADSSLSPKMPAGPEAEFGRVVHRLLELAAIGRIPASSAEVAFDGLLNDAAEKLTRNDQTSMYADLRVAFTRREWEKRRFLALERARELANSIPFSPPGRRREFHPASLKEVFDRRKSSGTPEVAFRSDTLRIQGRIDFLRVETDRTIEISDFKSGDVFDDSGEVEESTAIQLQLYALAVLEVSSGARLELRVVSRGGSAHMKFDSDEQEGIREWLSRRTSVLSEGSLVRAEEVAVMGPQCRTCPVRVVCPNYRTSVAALWQTPFQGIPLPLDTAGRILEIETVPVGLLSLKLRDLAGRVVKIHRLKPRVVLSESFDHANMVWFFNAASNEPRMRKGMWRHPRNFHEVPDAPDDRTAWTLRVLREVESVHEGS
jgi:RecB family exonuclease